MSLLLACWPAYLLIAITGACGLLLGWIGDAWLSLRELRPQLPAQDQSCPDPGATRTIMSR